MITPQSIEKEEPVESLTANRKVNTARVFHLEEVTKRWGSENGFVLSIPELTIRKGEKVALVGLSGCGKSTLLDLLAMVLRPDDAKKFTFLLGQGKRLDVIDAWRRKALNTLAQTRMVHMGYVLQTGGLLPFLSIRDNIGLSREGLGLPIEDAVERVADRLGIKRHLEKFPSQLSVGERQRTAIARAIVHEPSVIIADEPTASLDPINAEEIMTLFVNLTDEHGITVVVATHEWQRVEKCGFRRLAFNIEQDAIRRTVRTTVSG